MRKQHHLSDKFTRLTRISYPCMIFCCILVIHVASHAQSFVCTELSIAREHKGTLKRKSYAVSGLYLKFSTDSIKVFGNYRGRYISNAFTIIKTELDTIYAEGGFLQHSSAIKMVLRNNTLSSNYNIVDDNGESKVTLILSMKPVQNHFSEKYHKRKELEQNQARRRDLLGREEK